MHPIEMKDLGLMDYEDAFLLQKRYVAEKIDGTIDYDPILVLEHPSVFTLGKRGGRENLMVSEAFLEERGVPIVQTERGGNITYHGPGQLVIYPIIDLERRKMGVSDFVCILEKVMIETAAGFGVTAERNPINHGVWVGNAKIGSIGLSVKRGISFHGLALNVNLDLTPFSWVNPCGLAGVSMTSIENELKKKDGEGQIMNFPDMAEIKSILIEYLLTALRAQ